MSLKSRMQREWLEKRQRQPKADYPMATVAWYGPTDRRATKLVAALFLDDDMKVDEIEKWEADAGDLREDEWVLGGLVDWLKIMGVRRVVMVDRIFGCPHEEGIDYPEGEACPQCPYWADHDRFTGAVIDRPAPAPTVVAVDDGIEITYSGLCRTVMHEGVRLDVQIYGSDPKEWFLEVVNERGTSTVWDDRFETDEIAFAMFEKTLREEGLEAFGDE